MSCTRTLRAVMSGLTLSLALTVSVAACDLFIPPTKMDKGQLYESGDSRFDQYFATVHRQQVNAIGWDEERRNTRKQLVALLQVIPTASDASILAALRGHRTDPVVVSAAADTARAEKERAVKLRGRAPALEDLAKQGESLVGRVRDTFRADGEPKVREVRDEVNASVSVLNGLASRAKSDAADADHFVDDMNGALQGRLPTYERGAAEAPAPSPATAPAAPASDAGPKSATTTKPDVTKPKPADKSPDEVFNP